MAVAPEVAGRRLGESGGVGMTCAGWRLLKKNDQDCGAGRAGARLPATGDNSSIAT